MAKNKNNGSLVNKKVKQVTGGLDLDSSPLATSPGSYLFALNMVNDSEEGGILQIGNENSNFECSFLPNGYVPLGRVYIGDDEEAVLLKDRDSTMCQIGILSGCKYTPHVVFPLGFKISHQIDIIYRLRRGCEKVIYWVDGDNNKPMFYNFAKAENFKISRFKNQRNYNSIYDYWDINKFDQDKYYKNIPRLDIKTLDSGGTLKSGGVAVAIQYLDADLNPTQWIFGTEYSNIYKDSVEAPYPTISGSITSEEEYYNYGKTSKSIRITTTNLDRTFLFYRLAFIHKDNGSGLINGVYYSDKLSTDTDIFIYTGDNYAEKGTLEEVRQIKALIKSAESIEQIDNMQILGNVRGSSVEYCKLQRFASKITVDVQLEKVFLNVPKGVNPKNPDVHFEGVGYMPGEYYSFGIVYIFDDNTESPVYHIPGDRADNREIWSPGNLVRPMNNDIPEDIETTYVYTDNSNCSNNDYWGLTQRGYSLLGSEVRHHRFPTRKDLGIPLITKEESYTIDSNLVQLKLEGSGCVQTSCDPTDETGCTTYYLAEEIYIKVEYTVNGITNFLTTNFNPDREYSYGDDLCFDTDYDIWDNTISPLYDANDNIVVVKIEEKQGEGGSWVDVTNGTSPAGISYSTRLIEESYSSEEQLYSSYIMGAKFSNIEFPTEEEIGGKIIGYYLVRQERKEKDKTILDSAVMLPCIKSKDYYAHGLLGPEGKTPLLRDIAFINPNYKFDLTKYNDIDEIEYQGKYNITEKIHSRFRYRDVLDGSSFDAETDSSKKDREDYDGWSLKAITRDNRVEYVTDGTGLTIPKSDIEAVFYLKALESREDFTTSKITYNISADNRVGFIHLNNDAPVSMQDTFPYVHLKRKNTNMYSDFRNAPYYKISNYVEITDTTIVFGGDTYVSSMRYVSTVFWENKITKRIKKKPWWKYALGGLAIVVGILLLPVGGSGTLAIAAGVALIGAGLTLGASGIQMSLFNKAYNEEYKKGLRDSLLDDWVDNEYRYTAYDPEPNKYGPQDDEIQWIGEAISDLWFDTTINMGLRLSMTSLESFLPSPSVRDSGSVSLEDTISSGGYDYVKDNLIYPITYLDKYISQKLTTFNGENIDSKGYMGHPLGEWYKYNPDYQGMNNVKSYFHLALEYDCCSDCNEEFPHRIMWSQQSFQEELSDNYRSFLPNNYKNISGETGVITDLFTIKNNVYVHTEDALWHLPGNHQERITDSIVSFIGTGSYFNIPPRKIVLGEYLTGGCTHKWATIKLPFGIFFISERDKKAYIFDGNKLTPISEQKMSNWFEAEGHIEIATVYKKLVNRKFQYSNNPVNILGAGYISTYDRLNKRIILTKRDNELSDEVTSINDPEVCFSNGVPIIFPDFNQIIETRENARWNYVGIVDCRMKFERIVHDYYPYYTYEEEIVDNYKDIVIHLDLSGSFNTNYQSIVDVILQWEDQFREDNPQWLGKLYFIKPTLSATSSINYTERGWSILNSIDTGTDYNGDPVLFDRDFNTANPALINKDVIGLTFVNEATVYNYGYHSAVDYIDYINTGSAIGPLDNPSDYPVLIHDLDDFKTRYNNRVAAGGSFIGLAYPMMPRYPYSIPDLVSPNYLQHVLAVLKGVPYTQEELNAIPYNPYIGGINTRAVMESNLIASNPYPDDGLENYGWKVKANRGYDEGGEIINLTTFTSDIEGLLAGEIGSTRVYHTGTRLIREVEYVDGIVIDNVYKNSNSWTMSYDMKRQKWISWHSYMPNFYYFDNDSFFSWVWNNNYIWSHNYNLSILLDKPYQTFYGETYPAIIEPILNSNPITTKIWEDIMLHTECSLYDTTLKTFIKDRYTTFNKLWVYNDRQCSGELILVPKDEYDTNYLSMQIKNLELNKILIDRNESDWTLNNLRDIRTNYDVPIFIKDKELLKDKYFIDKSINDTSVDFNKNWSELEIFRSKYLILRLIFDNLGGKNKLVFNLLIDTEGTSYR